MIRTDSGVPSTIALDAEQAWSFHTSLEKLQGPITAEPVGGVLRVAGVDAHVDCARVDPKDVPMAPDLRSATWSPFPPDHFKGAARVAGLAAEPKEDRPALSWVRLGPNFVDATDEVAIATIASPLNFAARVPADVLEFAVLKKEPVLVGDLGGGATAICAGAVAREAEITIITQPPPESWFPDLRKIWEKVERSPVVLRFEVGRSELQAAARAAASGIDSLVVELEFCAQAIRLGGGLVVRQLAVPASKPAGKILLSVKALNYALTKGPTTLNITFRGEKVPLELSDATGFRCLIYPVVKRS